MKSRNISTSSYMDDNFVKLQIYSNAYDPRKSSKDKWKGENDNRKILLHEITKNYPTQMKRINTWLIR